MSDDLVKRLRGWVRDIHEGSTALWAMDQDLKAAADRIEELEANGLANRVAILRLASNVANLEAERDALADRIEGLEKACAEWAEVSQSNYQRAKAAEAKLAKAEARLKKECGFFVHCYWDADDREIGHFDICEILDAYDFGTVAEIEHVAVIATTFEAQLPPADDSETDDLFEVCEHTREAAEAKVAAEISRRTALAELKGQD